MNHTLALPLRAAAGCLISVALTLCTALAQAAVPTRTLALTGVDDELSPILKPGITFRTIASPSRIPSLANDARVAFTASIQGAGVSGADDSGLWLAGPHAPQLLAREGDMVPGFAPGVRFGLFLNASINDTGRIVFGVQLLGLAPNGAARTGYFSLKDGQLHLIAHAQQILNDIDGEDYQLGVVDDLSFAGPERVYFRSGLGAPPGGGSNDWALFEWSEAGTRLIARRHVAAPGFGAGIEFASADGPPAFTTPGGKAAFQANVGVNASSPLTSVLYTREGDSTLPAVVEPQSPELPGVTLSPYDPVINARGDIAFQAFLAGASIPTTDVNALFLKSAAGLRLIVRGGQAALPASHVFSGFESFAMNDAASVVFVAETRLPPSTFAGATGVWRSRGGELEPLALIGEQAPGTQSPTTFERFAFVNQNAAGLITFTANAETAAHALLPGVWALNASGQLLSIANAETPIELRPGDSRVPSFGAFASTSNATRPLNDANQMLFYAVFPDDAYALLIASVPPGCPADFNADAVTNGLDLSILLSQFGQALPPGSGADANGDAIVDGRDLSVLLGSFSCTP